MFRYFTAGVVLAVLFTTAPAWAQIDVGSDGSDGVFNPTTSDTIDLALAALGDWDSPGSGAGVYDSTMWAVVFKYSSVDIPAGVDIHFRNHPSGAPVVWLVDGDATIAGGVYLDGEDGTGGSGIPAEPGPGGFHGGRAYFSSSSPGGGGGGPGGGPYPSGAGSYGTVEDANAGSTYGNASLLPLIGGSGGAADNVANQAGGAGGGAMLIAANDTIRVTGTISARGGTGNSTVYVNAGSGSGGGIRLIADGVVSTGVLDATGPSGTYGKGQGGAGRIRVEGNALSVNPTTPNFTMHVPLGAGDPEIWPASDAPTIQILTIDGVSVPGDPEEELLSPPGDVNLSAQGPVSVTLSAANVSTSSTVGLRVVPVSGDDFFVTATLTGGDNLISTWAATIDSLPPSGFASIQARVQLP